jgi:hypothetical protein
MVTILLVALTDVLFIVTNIKIFFIDFHYLPFHTIFLNRLKLVIKKAEMWTMSSYNWTKKSNDSIPINVMETISGKVDYLEPIL